MILDLPQGRVTCDITQDGARNAVFDIVGDIHGDLPPTRVIDISTLFHEKGYDITKLRLDWVQYYVDEGLLVELLWEGKDTHKHILKLSGKGKSEHEKMGGKQNNHEDPLGHVMLATNGFSGERKTFSIEIEAVKQFT